MSRCQWACFQTPIVAIGGINATVASITEISAVPTFISEITLQDVKSSVSIAPAMAPATIARIAALLVRSADAKKNCQKSVRVFTPKLFLTT